MRRPFRKIAADPQPARELSLALRVGGNTKFMTRIGKEEILGDYWDYRERAKCAKANLLHCIINERWRSAAKEECLWKLFRRYIGQPLIKTAIASRNPHWKKVSRVYKQRNLFVRILYKLF